MPSSVMSQLMRCSYFNVLLVVNTLEKWAKSLSVIVISYNSFTDRVWQKTLISLASWEDIKCMIFNVVLVVGKSDNIDTQTSSNGVWYVASFQTAHILRVSITSRALSGDTAKRKILHLTPITIYSYTSSRVGQEWLIYINHACTIGCVMITPTDTCKVSHILLYLTGYLYFAIDNLFIYSHTLQVMLVFTQHISYLQ